MERWNSYTSSWQYSIINQSNCSICSTITPAFTKKSIPLIKKSKNGSIINISSTAGILGFPLRSPYAASKWAIIGVTKTLAMELGKFNIRVNSIAPSITETDMYFQMNEVARERLIQSSSLFKIKW